MAGRHVQRILSPRSQTTNFNSQREAFEKSQTVSISKAVGGLECPVKEKHVRRIIIGTFQEKSGYIFWHIIRKMPVQDNPIVCWKFCHVLHKLLREGYRKAIIDSYNYRQWILDTGKMWGLLKEGYGKLIQNYCTLLVNKIEFHIHNPRFPGNLQVNDEELNAVGENDVNVFFQLSCEMFDYLDEILCLQSSIFGSLDMSRSSSMTNHGQCKLAPLIPCIQDSSQLYDYSVKVLFKLHSVLPASTLEGHRSRFLNQFKILKQFYINSSNLQYFRNLIQVPLLPDNPPNFLQASDLNSHVTPIVVLPNHRESPDGTEHVENLVDLNFPEEDSKFDNLTLVKIDDDFEFNMNNKNDRSSIDSSQSFSMLVENLQRKLTDLEIDKVELDRKLVQIKMENEVLIKEKDELKAELNRSNVDSDDAEKKNRVLEKYNVMKGFYNELREEHIVLLRKKAEVDKELIKIKSDYEKIVKETSSLEKNIENNNKLSSDYEKITQKYNSIKDFNSKLLNEISTIKQENDYANLNLEKLENKLISCENEFQLKESKIKNEFFIKILKKILKKLSLNLLKIPEEDELENYNMPNISNSPVNFFERFIDLSNCLKEFDQKIKNFDSSLSSNDGTNEHEKLLFIETVTEKCSDFNYKLIYLFFMSKIVQQSISNLNTSEELNSNFIKLTNFFKEFYDQLEKLIDYKSFNIDNQNYSKSLNNILEMIDVIVETKNQILPHLSCEENKNLQEILEQEINQMEFTIQEAVSKIETMLETSKKHDKHIKLEVNGSILESCTDLMKAIKKLINDSRELQKEIVNEGKGSHNIKEFYQKNHRWTEGLISASKVVAYSAKMLVDSADQVVTGKAEFATIIVASQEIAAATAQLVAASKVKANTKSTKLAPLLKSSKLVNKATGDVIATTKNCNNLLSQEQNESKLEEELQKLTIHNAKKVEMECQLNIIKLENELVNERLKLAHLRRLHYHLNE